MKGALFGVVLDGAPVFFETMAELDQAIEDAKLEEETLVALLGEVRINRAILEQTKEVATIFSLVLDGKGRGSRTPPQAGTRLLKIVDFGQSQPIDVSEEERRAFERDYLMLRGLL